MKKIFLALALATLMGCQADGGGLDGSNSGGGPAPSPAPGDADGDGVTDASDLCPNTPAGHLVDGDGCSLTQLDTDGDGVNDSEDLCPGTTADQIAAGVDNNGCAVEQYGDANQLPADLTCTSFKTGTAQAKPEQGSLCALGTILDLVLEPLGTTTCSVTDAAFAADADQDSFAQMQVTAAAVGLIVGDDVNASVGIEVVDGGASSGSAGDMAAFILEHPASALADVSLVQDLIITTYLGGVEQETINGGEALQLGLIGTGAIGIDTGRLLIGFIASMPYDKIDVVVSGGLAVVDANVDLLADATADVNVYGVCQDAAIDPTQVAP